MTGESPGVAYREGSTVDRTIRIVVIVQAVLVGAVGVFYGVVVPAMSGSFFRSPIALVLIPASVTLFVVARRADRAVPADAAG